MDYWCWVIHRTPSGNSYSQEILFPPRYTSLIHSFLLATWRVDDLSFFEYLSPFCFLLIEFHCAFSINFFYQIMFIIIVFRLGCDRPSGLLLLEPAVLFSMLRLIRLINIKKNIRFCLFIFCASSSMSLSYFILAVPMRECLGKYSCMSFQFPIVILNGTSSFLSLVQENINMPSRHYYRLCS